MRPDGIVLASPGFNQNLRLLQRVKYLAVEELIAQADIDAFNIAVLPRTVWRDISRLSANGSDPRLDRLGDELRPIARYEREWPSSWRGAEPLRSAPHEAVMVKHSFSKMRVSNPIQEIAEP